jgi:hypothetical protein
VSCAANSLVTVVQSDATRRNSVAFVLGAVVAPALGERAVLAQDVAKANPRATAELTLSGCLLEGPRAIGTSGRTASPEQSPGAAARTAVIVPPDAKTTTMSESAFDLEVHSVRTLAPSCTD